MTEISGWKIWIDTGGTFTDCLAIDPGGKEKRAKVLSSGTLRAKVIKSSGRNSMIIRHNWDIKKDLLSGYTLKFFDRTDSMFLIRSFDPENSILEVEHELNFDPSNKEIELTASEEAPVLAARIVTETPLNADLPRIDMRLGSTRGTNALLEQKGTRPLLLTTKGFADLHLIGDQQRPDLFSLDIIKARPLFERVIEVDERIDASGNVIRGMTESYINTVLREVYASKAKVVVIAFMNSYKNPAHEKAFLNLLKTAGYKFVCASHQLEQSIKFFPRLQTALVNGYLMPVINDYLNNVQNKPGKDSTLKIMTSSGGLNTMNDFNPKDSLLSGPAGGVTGAANIVSSLGIQQIISFDMGGTSTDVSRFSGQYDYVYETRVGDYRILSPALYIETVAAGGGSICAFDGFKLTVGPDSAGAQPGPACYGAGGPLALTDIDLLLGRINPQCFGIPVEKEFSLQRLHELKSRYNALSALSDEEILNGFFEISNEKMAKAIEKISVSKGYDPASYSLLAFGGAGGIHACSIAALLGMKKIIVPYDAGILSAYGIGHARIERIISRQFLRDAEDIIPQLPAHIHQMQEEGFNQLKKENIAGENMEVVRLSCYLRFKGQDNTIEVTYTDPETLLADFKTAYQKLYGHYIENRKIEIESLKLIVANKDHSGRMTDAPKREYNPAPSGRQDMFLKGNWEKGDIYRIDDLDEGARIKGPALVLNNTSTTCIDAGWTAIVNSRRDLILDQISVIRSKPDSRKPEEVQLELFTNRFRSVAMEMGALLQRTAFSVNIKERLDFSCALLDAEGFLVVNAPHIPVHLGALGLCTRQVLQEITPAENDILITNHPGYGGSHLPDVTLIAPLYFQGKLIAYLANRAHHAEIGGISPGSMPADAVNLAQEGVVIAPRNLVKNGKDHLDEIKKILTQGPWPTRSVNENMADLQAAIASIRAGQEQLKKFCNEFGADQVIYYMKALRNYAGNIMRQQIGKLLSSPVRASEKLDDGSILSVNLLMKGDKIIIDFDGTEPQHTLNMNATPAIVYSAVLYVLRLLIREDIPLNEGMLDNVEIRIPQGSLLDPVFHTDPSLSPAVVGGNVEVSQRLVDTLLKAFGVVACSQGTMNNILFGNEKFGFYETICGGVGAGNGFNGASAVHQHMTNTKITDPEVMEHRYPVRVEEFSIRKNSGGQGKWKGGDGVIRKIRFIEPVRLTILSQHRKEKPYGLLDGEEGMPGEQYLIDTNNEAIPLEGICTVEIKAGEALLIKTPGGGGYGKTE